MVPVANSHPLTSRPFRANRLNGWFPGLRPWAESFSPFGAGPKGQDSVGLFNRTRARRRPPSSSSPRVRRDALLTSRQAVPACYPRVYPGFPRLKPCVGLFNRSRSLRLPGEKRRNDQNESRLVCPAGSPVRPRPTGKTNYLQNSQLTS